MRPHSGVTGAAVRPLLAAPELGVRTGRGQPRRVLRRPAGGDAGRPGQSGIEVTGPGCVLPPLHRLEHAELAATSVRSRPDRRGMESGYQVRSRSMPVSPLTTLVAVSSIGSMTCLPSVGCLRSGSGAGSGVGSGSGWGAARGSGPGRAPGPGPGWVRPRLRRSRVAGQGQSPFSLKVSESGAASK